jgi:hypothetical protein
MKTRMVGNENCQTPRGGTLESEGSLNNQNWVADQMR